MGWCSGTSIFDATVETVLMQDITDQQKIDIIIALTDSMRDHDWDCTDDSDYADHPIVIEAWRQYGYNDDDGFPD